MRLTDEQATARAEQLSNDAGPSGHVRQPAQRTDSGVDQIKNLRAQCINGVVYVRFMEVDVGASALGQSACMGQRDRGKVQAGHMSAQPRKGQCVGPDVALQVHAALPSHVAKSWTVEADHATYVLGIADESIETVVRGGGMNRGPFIPHGLVDRDVIAHARQHPTEARVGRSRPASAARSLNRHVASPLRPPRPVALLPLFQNTARIKKSRTTRVQARRTTLPGQRSESHISSPVEPAAANPDLQIDCSGYRRKILDSASDASQVVDKAFLSISPG